MQLLRDTVARIPQDIPVILDGKFGDIANTADHYARFAYDVIGADAVTVNPYMGDDAVRPFVREDKLVFVLAKTSNKSQYSMQNMALTRGGSLARRRGPGSLQAQRRNRRCGAWWALPTPTPWPKYAPSAPSNGSWCPAWVPRAATWPRPCALACAPTGPACSNTSRAIWQAEDAAAAARELVEQMNQLRPVTV